jgi:hypothetical protein
MPQCRSVRPGWRARPPGCGASNIRPRVPPSFTRRLHRVGGRGRVHAGPARHRRPALV